MPHCETLWIANIDQHRLFFLQLLVRDGNGTLTSLQAAEAVQSRLPSALSTTNRGVKSRPDLLILNSTTVPAILIETCFLSNPGDALKISQATYQDAAAKAIGDGIIYAMSNYKLR